METMVAFNNFYKGKKVFITGHTGFKGSWLSAWLLLLGAKVKGYALEPKTARDHYVAAGLESKFESVIAEIRDFEKLKKELCIFKPEVVFHLAAQPLVLESYIDPAGTYQTNIIGTVNVLDAIRSCPSVISFINVTTDKCYENFEKQRPYCEDDPLGGYDPYSSSKACSEIVTSAYRRSFFNNNNGCQAMICSARAGNVIGGGDWQKYRIMTDSINSLINNQPIEVRNPQSVRPWQHVMEPLSGYLWLAAQACKNNWIDYAQAFNFGPNPDDLVTVKNFVELIIENWQDGKWKDVSNGNNLHESGLLLLDSSKAEGRLGWKSLLLIADSVKIAVEWYKNQLNGNVPAFDYSLGQIKNYMDTAGKLKISWAEPS